MRIDGHRGRRCALVRRLPAGWRPHVARFPLTHFEMGHAGRLWLFERAGLDFAVLEVGLWRAPGCGQPDRRRPGADHQHRPDHADWLGDTRESVAFEKAGGPARRQPAPCGDLDPPQPLLEQVAARWGTALPASGRDYDLAFRRSWLALSAGWADGQGAGAARSAVASAAHGVTLRWLCRPHCCSKLPWQAGAWPRRCGGPG